MKVVHLFTKTKIDSNKLFSFLKEIKIKVLGLWDNEEIDTLYGAFATNKIEFNKSIENPIGLNYTVEYDNRETTISLFKNSNINYELKIFLSSLDLVQREMILEELKKYILKEKKIFEILFYDIDDDSHEIDLADIYKFVNREIPKSIKLILGNGADGNGTPLLHE